MNLPKRFLVGAALTVMLIGGACSSNGATNGSNATTPSRSAAVSLRGLAFAPAAVTISAGRAVTWTDDEEVEHTVTAGTPNAPDEAEFHKVLMNGETFSVTFDELGTYEYFCQRHPTNMQGTVTVR